MEKRTALDSRFTVFVVPNKGFVSGGVTIPKVISPTGLQGYIPIAAEAGPGHVEAAPWAFKSKASRLRVAKQLRALANWLETV